MLANLMSSRGYFDRGPIAVFAAAGSCCPAASAERLPAIGQMPENSAGRQDSVVVAIPALAGWREVLAFVQPGTVLSWQRKRFREHWARISRHVPPGRPTVSKEVRDLIRRMSRANPD